MDYVGSGEERNNLDGLVTMNSGTNKNTIPIKSQKLNIANVTESACKTAFALLDKLEDVPDIYYHTKKHTTKYVYPQALEIGKLESLSKRETMLLSIAAAFHDVGFIEKYMENETVAEKYAEQFMRSKKDFFTEREIATVCETIRCTDQKTNTDEIIAKILIDADMSSIGLSDFIDIASNLKKEYSKHPEQGLMYQKALTDSDWWNMELKFIKEHKWLTSGATTLFNEEKRNNIEKVKQLVDRYSS